MLQVVDPSSLLWAILRLYVTTLICLIPLSICLLYSLLRLIKCTDASEASILCSLAGCAFYGIVISSLWREDLQSQSKTKAPPIVLKVYTLSSESNEDDDGDDSIRPRKRCDMMSPCPICLEEFSDGDKVCYGEQCDHFYHACCICQCELKCRRLLC